MQSGVLSMSIIVLRLTPRRLLTDLLLSSRLCPVSIYTNRSSSLIIYLCTLTPEHFVCDSSSMSSTHVLRSLPNIQLDNRLWLVQHTSTVRRNSHSRKRDLSCFEAVESPAPLILLLLSFRCSDGIDRHRQEWLDYNCPEEVRQLSHVYIGEMSSYFLLFLE